MLFNQKKRIQYLGFDDIWFSTIGILLLSFATSYLFNDSLFQQPTVAMLITWLVSLFFTICNWLFMRYIMIQLRIRFPNMNDTFKRIGILFVFLLTSVLLIDIIGNIFLLNIAGDNYNPMRRFRVVLPIVIISVMVQAIYEAIYYFLKLKKSIREEEQTKQMIVQAQLDALKNQAQPHFFFNSLNTLRDIIDQNTKEDAKDFVGKLSDMYRFILESGKVNLIPLDEEISFAKAYLHIQKERFGENLRIQWNVSDSNADALVVPMSLQLLLENAIKHNIVSRSKPLHVNIKSENNSIVVENKIQLKTSQLPSTKMGLKNIEQRYQLISDKSPVIKNDGETFYVSLPLLQLSDQKFHHADTHN